MQIKYQTGLVIFLENKVWKSVKIILDFLCCSAQGLLICSLNVSVLGLLLLLSSCNFFQKKQTNKKYTVSLEEGALYANEYGSIQLIPKNDSLVQVIFSDNEQVVFETPMEKSLGNSFLGNTAPFLHFKTGGIEIQDHALYLHDFAGPAHLGRYVAIEKIYDRPFYKIGQSIRFTDEIHHPKGGVVIDGIYLKNNSQSQELVTIEGIVKKEKYPIAYYSTDDSPQGKFFDTTKVHYRLTMEDYQIIHIFEQQEFKGKTINSNGKAAFIWELADSAIYELDDRQKWSAEEEHQLITIEGVLLNIDGRLIIKDWKRID